MDSLLPPFSLSDRTGPGAGRPSKLYARSDRRLSVSLPQRNYELIARALVSAAEASSGARTVELLQSGVQAYGRSLGMAASSRKRSTQSSKDLVEQLTSELAEQGFEPVIDADGTIRLGNCPYHAMARESTPVVCALNLDLMTGIAEGMGASNIEASLEPTEGMCCVAFRHRAAAERPG